MKAPGLKCIKAFLIGSGVNICPKKSETVWHAFEETETLFQGAHQIFHKTVDFNPALKSWEWVLSIINLQPTSKTNWPLKQF